jgi:hypothetical protein
MFPPFSKVTYIAKIQLVTTPSGEAKKPKTTKAFIPKFE